ncbi:hypothetical protein BVRB_2g044930 [Beta vulgaris subsp. vulgaris]|uniref:Protein kinase domain-containing protein n=1 Tax=Beta vulgaris subsp. vulgaris TaxID=3555 RepID=A0A0J8BH86_BETVV|nr:hypothetical protein BVRB_2g044930 [Beta vulgaris subsp. vulgaris]
MVGTRLKKKVRQVWKRSRLNLQVWNKYLIFRRSEEHYIKNGALVLEESIKLFHGKANPIRHFSVDDLNNMNVEREPYFGEDIYYGFHRGLWQGIVVSVKIAHYLHKYSLHELVVATQMVTHNNAHKILGCCLETETPVLVYEWVGHYETLDTHIRVRDENNGQKKRVLEWKDRLRIAWEISHVVAYLHTAFPRPILHLNVIPKNVLLDLDNTARLSDFSDSISIPEGEESVKRRFLWNGHVPPENDQPGNRDRKVAQSTDVYAFGMLFFMLLRGNDSGYRMSESAKKMLQYAIKNKLISNFVDPAITRNTVSTIEDLQLRASIELVNRCITVQHCRPTMVEVATQLKNMIRLTEGDCIYRNFQGSKENFVTNEAIVHKESISLFGDRVNPVRYFSVNELNNMNVEIHHCHSLHHGSWEGRAILVKLPENIHWNYFTSSNEIRSRLSREIVIAAQMSFHNNVHKLLGCCLETKVPVIVYEWMQNLEDCILHRDENKDKLPLLEWKDRLRIAWEISHCFSCLHTAFHRPIIFNWEHHDVFLDQDNTPKLSFSVSITEDEENGIMESDEVVKSFGILILVLLTGKTSEFSSSGDGESTNLTDLINWVTKETTKDHINEILDPVITRIGVTKIDAHQMSASLELALWCTTTEVYLRPPMLEIATKLKNMIENPESILTTNIFFQGTRIYKIFRGSEENFKKNETMVLEESISFLVGVDAIRYFSVDELNNMNVEQSELDRRGDVDWNWNWYQGSWEGRAVLVKLSDGVIYRNGKSTNEILSSLSREIVIATHMGTHENVHKLLGCCLETEFPVLVYEWMETRLEDRIVLKDDENQKKLPALELKDRLRIAWEISQLLYYFHTAFHRPIFYKLPKFHMPAVFLDQDNTAKLSDLHNCCPISVGEENSHMAANVLSFGHLLISLLTGKSTFWIYTNITGESSKEDRISKNVDPVLSENGVATTKLNAAIKLAVRCIEEKTHRRPTMVYVAAKLYNMIKSSKSTTSSVV